MDTDERTARAPARRHPRQRYYPWIESLFRVLDDIDRTAAARWRERPDAAPSNTSAHALDAQAARLRALLREGCREQFVTEEFVGACEGLIAACARLAEGDGRDARRISPHRFDRALRACRRAVFMTEAP